MDSIEVLYLPEAGLELVARDIFHPYAGCIVFVMARLVDSGNVNYRTALECL